MSWLSEPSLLASLHIPGNAELEILRPNGPYDRFAFQPHGIGGRDVLARGPVYAG